MLFKFFTFSRFTLFIALAISIIAAWYSVVGLTAIFAAAVIPIIIMGGILEAAKIVTTVWLHKYWNRTGILIRTYLTAAVILLAMLTSMGIFGFLSKAHIDQGVPTSDIAAQVSLIDEKIKTQRENIELARKALAQMDAQVEQRLSRSDSEQGAERAVQIRRQQAQERNKLQKEIADAQAVISKLNEERAPIASQLRKVEAEVGPIKYIAALIYGDEADQNMLERAVRWVIIIIVVVFDPLAIILILAANKSLVWEREDRKQKLAQKQTTLVQSTNSIDIDSPVPAAPDDPKAQWPSDWGPAPDLESNKIHFDSSKELELELVPMEKNVIATESVTESVTEPEVKPSFVQKSEDIGLPVNSLNVKYNLNIARILKNSKKLAKTKQAKRQSKQQSTQIENVQSITIDERELEQTVQKPRFSSDQEYVHYDGKLTSINALREIRPDLIVSPEKINQPVINFGSKFPREAINGELFIRVDSVPHRVYKFNGEKWINVDKNQSSVYLQNNFYLEHLVKLLSSGEYDIDYLTADEQDEISKFLNQK